VLNKVESGMAITQPIVLAPLQEAMQVPGESQAPTLQYSTNSKQPESGSSSLTAKVLSARIVIAGNGLGKLTPNSVLLQTI